MKKYIFIFLFAVVCTSVLSAQTNVIVGNASASSTTTVNYKLTSTTTLASGTWEVTGGITPYIIPSVDNLSFKCSIKWTSAGTYTITFKNGTTIIDTHVVTVSCTPPAPSLMSGTYPRVKGRATLIAELPASYNGAYDFHWYNAASGGTLVGTGSVFTTPVLTATTQYWVATFEPGSLCESVRVQMAAKVLQHTSFNQLVEETVRVKGVKTDQDLQALTDATQRRTIRSHYDGLMRLTQQIAMKVTPGGNDLIQPIEYDSLGRTSKQYLPYAAANTYGEFQSQYELSQSSFYSNTTDAIADDAKPYAVTHFEKSPLGRVTNLGAVGDGFQPGQGHTSRVEYLLNNANEVRNFNSDGTSTGYWSADKLYKVVNTNAHDSKVITFTNENGQVILQKQQLDETIDNVMVNYLDTYYIYDELGRLKYMVLPKGVKALSDNSWIFSATIRDDFSHQFVYDKRGRLIEKKVPGQAWTYFVYDDLDRPILVQDGLLRADNKWMFTKYDFKGRAVMSGLYKNTTQTTRVAVQAIADGLYKTSNVTFGLNAWYESRGTILHGYSNTAFPKVNADNTALEILAVNYYDTHDFDFNGSADYAYTAQALPNENTPGRTRGLPTGSKRLILGTTTWLYSYQFYDEYGRVIQTRSNNHLNPSVVDNINTVVYLFDGTVTTTQTKHNAGGTNVVTVLRKFTYDDQGRLLEVKQSNNGSADQIIASYTYNELGQLIDKKLHNTGGSNYLQSVDFRYTIRGQLKSINNAQLTNDGITNNDTGDYFGMELLYDQTESGLNTATFDGSISAIKWKGAGDAAGAADQKSYKYTYDKTGKLKSSVYQMKGASLWNKEVGVHNESLTYDHNGNIRSLQRNQRKHLLSGTTASYTAETIDNLTYTYNASVGDQLIKVEDATSNVIGFKNGANQGTEYTYDVAGNLTTDQNKGITSVVYNFLGKPTSIVFLDGKKLEYTYDAGGAKLIMKTWQGTTLISTTDYVDGFVYENATLNFFPSSEGRVVKKGSAFEYEYAIADYQGNTRVVFSSVTPAPEASTATFEGDGADASPQFINGTLNVVSFGSANHTTGGSKVVRMNQNNKVGPAKSIKVFPGDKIDMEVWEYHEITSGYGTTSTPLANVITLVSGAFTAGVTNGTEVTAINSGVNSALTAFGAGSNQGDGRPAAYLNFILFDKDYKVLDAGYQLAPAASFTKQKLSFPQKTIKEQGYLYVWVSYDNASNNYVYFDDMKITHTKNNIVQYNEYYPYGLQTSTSWTRDNSKNNFLYNGGSELNSTSGWYETFFRGYDPALGRFVQIDPMAASEHATYQYAGNNPVMFNDPTGLSMYDVSDPTGSKRLRAHMREGLPIQRHSDWHFSDVLGDDTSQGGGRGYGSATLDAAAEVEDALKSGDVRGAMRKAASFGWTLELWWQYSEGQVKVGNGDWETVDYYNINPYWKVVGMEKNVEGPGEPWYLKAAKSYYYKWGSLFGGRGSKTPGSWLSSLPGIVWVGRGLDEYGLRPVGDKYVIFDLNDPKNILGVLQYRASTGTFEAAFAAMSIYNEDPRNLYLGSFTDRLYEFREIEQKDWDWQVPGHVPYPGPGYYRSLYSDWLMTYKFSNGTHMMIKSNIRYSTMHGDKNR